MPERIALPPLDQERIAALEERIVAAHRRGQVSRRRRMWSLAGVAAAVVVTSAVLGPFVGGGRTTQTAAPATTFEGSTFSDGSPWGLPGDASEDFAAFEELDRAEADLAVGDREIETAATATVRVAAVRAAVEAIGAEAEALGGYVETSRTSSTEAVRADGEVLAPEAFQAGAGGITIRVPAGRLPDALAALDTVGTVVSATTDRRDVTTEAVDLRARIDAARASVDRLSDLVAQAASTADLIAAESALAERQSDLDSMEQQLAAIEGRVALSSLAVTLVTATEVAAAEPAGFLDGLLAGWNGLIAALNGIVIGFGFLLPWLVIAGIVAVLVLLVRRRRRGRAAD